MSSLRRGIGDLDRERVDVVAAALIAIAIELELRTWIVTGPRRDGLVTAIAGALFAAPIATRRRWPCAALLVGAAVAPAQALLGGHLSEANGILLPPVLLAYGVGAWAPLKRGLATLAIAAGLLAGLVFTAPRPGSAGEVATDVFFLALMFAVPWFVGRLGREPGRRARAFGDLAAQVAAENDERERIAIAHERARIGDELQDIIAHSVSAMIVQAGGARRVLRSRPDLARASILSVEETGREALADLRRLLGMLRKDGDPRALAPQPGLDQLAALVRSMRAAGLDCELRCEGEAIALTPGADLVGYRTVESVLLEAAGAHGGRVIVTIRYSTDLLEIVARGDAAIPDLEQRLTGISQRLALYAGAMEHDPAVSAGFALRARLPLGSAAA
jgi:signal transduction histidine kinase